MQFPGEKENATCAVASSEPRVVGRWNRLDGESTSERLIQLVTVALTVTVKTTGKNTLNPNICW